MKSSLPSAVRSWLLSEETQKKRNDGWVARSDELKAKDADLSTVFRVAVQIGIKLFLHSTTTGIL